MPEDVLAKNEPKQIISQVSESITTFEVLDLLEGNPKPETVKAVEVAMNEIDPRMLQGIDTGSSVKTLFKN